MRNQHHTTNMADNTDVVADLASLRVSTPSPTGTHTTSSLSSPPYHSINNDELSQIKAMQQVITTGGKSLLPDSRLDIYSTYTILAKAFAWGRQTQDMNLRDAVIDEMTVTSSRKDDKGTSYSPGAIPVSIIYENTNPGDRARKVLVDFYVPGVTRFWDIDEKDDFCKDFLFDLARRLLAERAVNPNAVNVRDEPLGCSRHEHELHGKRCWKVQARQRQSNSVSDEKEPASSTS